MGNDVPTTTVVGSYPVRYAPGFKERIVEKLGRGSAYEEAIREAVRDQIEAGIELVSDGQVRGDMVEIFASYIPGMTVEDKPAIVGRVQPAPKSPLVRDYEVAVDEAGKDAEVKAILTGPVTLAVSCELRSDVYPSNTHPSLLDDITRALALEAERLNNAGAEVLQVDEPVLSTGMVSIEEAAEYINAILMAFDGTRVLHVCGNITTIYEELEEHVKADVFDHEFAGCPANLYAVAEGDKPIAVGIVRSDTDEVEELDEVVKRLERAVDVLGEDRIAYVDPDCGLRKLPREVAKKKLELVRKARDEVFGVEED
ncbi:MAG: methionine synthase [Methanopyri archaeon]|nr:methionine synthase [Methanopyri archaeon]